MNSIKCCIFSFERRSRDIFGGSGVTYCPGPCVSCSVNFVDGQSFNKCLKLGLSVHSHNYGQNLDLSCVIFSFLVSFYNSLCERIFSSGFLIFRFYAFQNILYQEGALGWCNAFTNILEGRTSLTYVVHFRGILKLIKIYRWL